MDVPVRDQSSQRKSRTSVKKSCNDGMLPAMKALSQSQKQLCVLSTEELKEDDDKFNEVTFLCFADKTAVTPKELAAMTSELPDHLKSLHLCSLNENEVIFLKDSPMPLDTNDMLKQKNHSSRILCVMRFSPSFPRLRADSVFTLLSKYIAGIRCTVKTSSVKKYLLDISHTEDDDTNQSVSSIEDDFVTALEHLDEDEPTKLISSGQVTPKKRKDASSQTLPALRLDAMVPKMAVTSLHRKQPANPSASVVTILGLKEQSSVRCSVTTSVFEPLIQKSFSRPHNSSDQSVNLLQKTLFSSSPAESSESDCSSPSPIIFLDEEGYQRSLKAKLQLPKLPVMKDGIEDSDSEVSEFFDSFDQFDEQEQTLESGYTFARDPILDKASQKAMISYKKSCLTTSAMNPQKFKFDRPTLPANIRKPTPRKPESPYSNLLDVPDSPRPMKTSGDDNGGLFSPIRSSAFSPLGNCFSAECLCQMSISREAVSQNHCRLDHTHSDFGNSTSFEILGCVFNSQSSKLCGCTQDVSNCNRIDTKAKQGCVSEFKEESSGKDQSKREKIQCKSLMIKDHIQNFASNLVEKSFGSALKDLQKGVASCTNALCHLAAKLTSSVFQMAFYEIGQRQAFSLEVKAINGLAGFLVGEAITDALKELRCMKQQIFTKTVAKFAADLAEELIFEGIMEVCQFSHLSTPVASQNACFHYDDEVVQSYAKDLSESVIQEAFIELSQVDVTFTTQAAISISVDDIKYVSAEGTLESTQTSNACSEFHNRTPIEVNPVQEFKKEYSVHRALFYSSGIASSFPVPLAGSLLFQNHTSSSENMKIRNHSRPSYKLKTYDSTQLCYTTKKGQDAVTSFRSICLSEGNRQYSECNAHFLCEQNDFKRANNLEIGNISEVTSGTSSINNFSGTMVDMIVTEAYEAVTSPKVSKTAEQYTDTLKSEKMPYLQCIGEDTCKNVFANYLGKRIVTHSVEETKSACSTTSEKLAYCVGLGTNKESNRKELQSSVDQFGNKKSVPVVVGQQQMPLSSSSKFHVTSGYPSKHLLSGSKDCVQERKSHIACRTSVCTSPPCSLTFLRCTDEFSDPESCSAKPSSNPIEKHHMAQACPSGAERSCLGLTPLASVMSGCGDALHMENKPSSRDGNLPVVPNTPPPTPLIPSQANSECNLRKLTKKLKGELAKEFAPATPPSTPCRSEADGGYENEHHYLEKEEFMLKLMRSLSEEVASSDDEEASEVLAEGGKMPLRTIEYADDLATHITSLATEMAASRLDDKTFQTENNKYFQLSVESKRCGYRALVDVPEKVLHSLWVYAGDVAGKVIDEATKTVKSRCKLLRPKQDSFRLKRDYHESRETRYHLVDRANIAFLSLPQNSEAPGLTSKYPSCESVTDEYADHIIRILKKEGGHSELIMDQFASRLSYRAVRSGMQQAARKLRKKHNRKTASVQNSHLKSEFERFDIVNRGAETEEEKEGNVRQFRKRTFESKCNVHKTECTKFMDFSDSLAHSITSDVRRTLEMSACLPKSLTDSCLYKKSKIDQVSGLTTCSKTLSPLGCKQKPYHSTESLDSYTYRYGIIRAIEQYARKVVDDTLEVSFDSASLQTVENGVNRATYAEKLSPFSATACRYCSMKEHQYCAGSASLHLPGQDPHTKIHQVPNARLESVSQKSHVLHLDIPQIHINMDEKVIFAENMVAAALNKAQRQLSNTSLAADSGIGPDGLSFADSLSAEIMTSCMTNIGQAGNVSCVGKEGFHSAESIISPQVGLSAGDDSPGSWSNLSFEDEHPDDNSSFLHLSDSNGNSSSWSSLGLEGDMYEENLSFPTSDSDVIEDKEEELKNTFGGLMHTQKSLVIINVDIGPCMVDSQLRMTLQWLSASEAEVAELRFDEAAPNELVLLSMKLQERGWKVGDLFQAVLKYCDVMEKASDGDRAPESKTFFGWLREHV